MNAEATAGLRAAAIEDDGTCDVDSLLAAVAYQQQSAGRRVSGLVMVYPEGAGAGQQVRAWPDTAPSGQP